MNIQEFRKQYIELRQQYVTENVDPIKIAILDKISSLEEFPCDVPISIGKNIFNSDSDKTLTYVKNVLSDIGFPKSYVWIDSYYYPHNIYFRIPRTVD